MELPITGPLNLFVFLETEERPEDIVNHEASLLAAENSKVSNSTVMAVVQGAVHGERPEEIEADLVSASSSGKQEPVREGITSAGRASFAIANHDDISLDMEN